MHDEIDALLAEAWGVPLGELRAPGVVVTSGPEHRVLALRLPRTCIVRVPAARLVDARAACAGRSVDEVYDGAFLRTIVEGAGEVFGPSRHAYVDAHRFTGVTDDRVVQIEPGDPLLHELRDAVGPDDWAEGGFHEDHGAAPPLYVLVDSGVVVAAGNLTELRRGEPGDVGLVTHPAHRARGFATAVAATMTAAWLPRVGLVRYRALVTNTASLAIATRLGFEPYGENLAVRF